MAAELENAEKTSAPPAPPTHRGQGPFPRLIRLCAGLVAVTGGGALLGWLAGSPLLSSLGSGNIPMAPSTAILFVLYSLTLFSRTRPPRPWVSRADLAITAAGTAVALLLFILSSRGVYLEAEHLGITVIHPPGETPIGHMSPATALCFLLASLSSFSSAAKSPRLATLAGLSASLLAASGFIFVLAYGYGAPLLYDSFYIPPAALTSMAFIFLGIALLALSLSPAKLVRLQAGTSPRALYFFILIFFLLAASILIAGFLAYRNYENNHQAEAERQLSAIAELKANELARYRQERTNDARLLSENASFATLVRRFLAKPEDRENEQRIQEWLNTIREHAGYDQVLLLDSNGLTRLSAPTGARPLPAAVAQHLPEVLESGQVVIHDFHQSKHDGRIYLAVLAPILDRENDNRPLGLISMRIDPAQYLYPFLQRWPIPSRTGETLLVRREGREVIFLNELKGRQDTALTLRFPLSQGDLPAAQAARGRTGITKGRDYLGHPVIADVRAIPDSPWFLVSKINASEIYAPMQEHLWQMGGFILSLLLGLGAIMAFFWQRQRVSFFRKQHDTVAALNEIETRYQHLYESMTDAFVQTTMAGEIVGVNRAFLNMVGYSEEETLRLTYQKLTPARWHAFEQRLIETQVLPFGSSELYEKEYLRKDGTVFPVELRAYLLRDKEGQPSGMWAIVRDISERKKAEAALRESQQLFATVANTSPALIWMSGLDKSCIWFNEPWLAFTGRALAEDPGDDWAAGVHPDDLAHCLQIYTEAFEARQPFAREYRLRRHDGEYRWLLDQGQPRYDAAGAFAGYIGSCLDITEHRNLEKKMRHAVKMESIGTLAGGVAHDFNNILMAIIGYGQLALISMPRNDPHRQNIEHMLEGADRAARLTKDLLLFSRKQISERKPVDLTGIVRTVEKFIVRVIGEDIACETRLPDEPLTVLADSHQLEQVLMNLATNARDAMPKGGTFSITAARTILHQDFIAAHGFGRPGPYALLTVSDNGFGMDEQTRSRIFEPFFTTKGVGKGTGLGLAVVYGIIKQHEGYINVYSEPDRGATFRIYLPLIVAAAPEEKSAEEEETPPHGTETILVAEDDASLRTLARTVLTSFGYTVIEAVDGEEAVQKFKENQDRIQLFLSDIIMPKMNGREAYKEISELRPGIKAIFMSGYTPDLVREKAAPEETAPLLAKPLSPAALLRQVRETLDQ